jgi:hypothetical protein
MTQLSPTGIQFIGSLNRSGFNRSIPTSPKLHHFLEDRKEEEKEEVQSKGKSINQLERKHALAQADKVRAQYSKGGKVSYKSISDMERGR